MSPLRRLGPLVVLPLAGCAAKPPAAAPAATLGVKLLDAGGDLPTPTPPFQVKGRGIRIEYRLSRHSPRNVVGIAALRDSGGDLFDPVSTVSLPLAGALSGSTTMSLIPGRYRLRLETDVPWNATVYESSK